jgi:hypothetical protein
VSEQILEPVPHRHVVLSLPRRLRPFFRRRRKRLTRLARITYEAVKELLQAAVGSRTAIPGAVACLQSGEGDVGYLLYLYLIGLHPEKVSGTNL